MKTNNTKKYLTIFSLLIIFSLSACTEIITGTFSSNKGAPQDESFADFMDVPYPANMSFQKKESFSYTRRNVLSGVAVATGTMNIDEVGAYYDQHLPPHGWTPVAEAQSSALVSTWKKDDKYLTIFAKPESFSLTSSLRLELWVEAPHLNSDLGQRVIYQKPTIKDSNAEPGNSGSSNAEHNSSTKDGVTAEDI